MTAEEPIRILHISMLGMPLSDSPGFKAQLNSEWRAAQSLRTSSGIDWRSALLVPVGNDQDCSDIYIPVVKIPKIYVGRLARRFYLWKYVHKAAKAYDIVLVRHSVVDPFESLSVRQLTNVAVIHHTKTVEEMQAGHPVLSRVEAGLQWVNRRWARWPIGVTAELAQYARGRGCRADSDLVLPNGIELMPLQTARARERVSEDVSALFVASKFATWHGLDRLLSALETWSPQNDERLILHLVGSLTDEQTRAVHRAQTDRVRIEIHGTLGAEETSQLASRADVGIGSLALDRQAMKDACTLKVREYLAAGLPVYSTHRDSGLPDGFPYYLLAGTVDVAQLVSFAIHMRTVDRAAVRLAAERYISKEAIMRRAGDGMLREIRDSLRRANTVGFSVSGQQK